MSDTDSEGKLVNAVSALVARKKRTFEAQLMAKDEEMKVKDLELGAMRNILEGVKMLVLSGDQGAENTNPKSGNKDLQVESTKTLEQELDMARERIADLEKKLKDAISKEAYATRQTRELKQMIEKMEEGEVAKESERCREREAESERKERAEEDRTVEREGWEQTVKELADLKRKEAEIERQYPLEPGEEYTTESGFVITLIKRPENMTDAHVDIIARVANEALMSENSVQEGLNTVSGKTFVCAAYRKIPEHRILPKLLAFRIGQHAFCVHIQQAESK